MWEYIKLRNGYVRAVGQYSSSDFMFKILSAKVNRTWWNRLMKNTICLIFKHKQSSLMVEKGFTTVLGSFEIVMCDRCRCGIIFYEGIEK